jgi:hypothetical protein
MLLMKLKFEIKAVRIRYNPILYFIGIIYYFIIKSSLIYRLF